MRSIVELHNDSNFSGYLSCSTKLVKNMFGWTAMYLAYFDKITINILNYFLNTDRKSVV